MSQTDFDIDEAKRKMKEQYEAETGEELPDHVVENLKLLNASGPTIEDMQAAVENAQAEMRQRYTSRQVTTVFLATAAVAGILGYGAGLAVASNFGAVVVALVAVAFGFVTGAIAAG